MKKPALAKPRTGIGERKRNRCISVLSMMIVKSKAKLPLFRLRSNAAMDADRGQVGGLIVHPEAGPFALHLAEGLGGIEVLYQANGGVAGILGQEAAGV